MRDKNFNLSLIILLMMATSLIFKEGVIRAEEVYKQSSVKASFTGKITDYKAYDDKRGKNYLNVDIEVEVKEEGNFIIQAFLLGGTVIDNHSGEKMYDVDTKNLHLAQGIHKVTLSFDGIKLFKGKFSEYILNHLGIYAPEKEGGQVFDQLGNIKLSQYDYREFQRSNIIKEFSIINGGSFSLEEGQTAVFEFEGFSDREILLTSMDKNAVVLRKSSFFNPSNEPNIDRQTVRLNIGEKALSYEGEEQSVILKLESIEGNTVSFKIRYGASPPAPKIWPWRKIKILVCK